MRKLALWIAKNLQKAFGETKVARIEQPPKIKIILVNGYSVTIDKANDKITIIHRPGDSMDGALAKHSQILAYLRNEGHL